LNKLFPLVVFSILLLVPAGVQNAFAASFTPIGFLPGASFPQSSANRISADGSVMSGEGDSALSSAEAFRWTPGGGMVGLGDLPGGGVQSRGFGLSADGLVVVGSSPSGVQIFGEAFRWTSGGGIVGLGLLPGGTTTSTAFGTSGDGSVVVGTSDTTANTHAFRWTSGGGMVDLGTLLAGAGNSFAKDVSDDGSVVVGFSDSGGCLDEAFRWTSGGGMVGIGDLPGGSCNSRAERVSADGTVIVGRGSSNNGIEAFRWTSGGGFQGLGDLPGGSFDSRADGVSPDGSIVVGLSSANNNPIPFEAFIWDNTNGIRNLNTVLTNAGVNLGGYLLIAANDVSSDNCNISGRAINPSGNIEGYRANICDTAIGGDLLPIDSTALILAGAQSFSWMIPVVLSGIGIGMFVVSRKSENS